MWRSPISLLWNLSAIQCRRKVLFPVYSMCSTLASNVIELPKKHCNTSSSRLGGEEISISEARKLLRLMNVEELKRKLRMERNEVISYSDLLKICESMGVARSIEEAAAFARVLDEAGLVLIFRDKVFLHPDKVVDLLARAVPLALTPEDDPMREELKMMLKKKEEIDRLAHRRARRILWAGFGFFLLQQGIFFRLTFWEFSWDLMEPVAFFMSTTGLLIGYAYFIFTSKDPTYVDLKQRLFLSRQRKLFRKHNFDIERLIELEKMCKSPLDHVRGVDVFHEH